MQDWVEKYRPQSVSDIVGNKEAVRQMVEWAKNWQRGQEPLLLYGKPGIGKTSAAYALARDMGWEIVELNASDQRTKGIIERIAGSTATTMSLTGASRKLLLFDEADNLHGSADRGGARAILDIIKISMQPIILIANDLYGIAKELKGACEPVQFKAIQARSIAPRLRYICSAEKISCSDDSIRDISESSSGDMRAAVNMLFAASAGKDTLSEDMIATAEKDERSTIFELVGAVLKGQSDRRLMELSSNISDTPDTTEQWVEESIFQMKGIESQYLAYKNLSVADTYVGNTYRRQYYTLWKYASSLMLIGCADAAGGCGVFERIMPPSRWRKMAGGKKQKNLRIRVLNKLSEGYHVPEDTLRDELLTSVSVLVDLNPMKFAKDFELDKDELNFFLHDNTRSAEIIKEIKKEIREREKAEKKKEKSLSSKKTKKLVETVKEKPPAQPEISEKTKDEKKDTISSDEENENGKKQAETQSTLFSF
ncbi:replication factor C large subunit [Methanoplanus sp. FWC-SCC4]|uniref:Replication factor C large subunit n=1 Tax=Methanochimaera problematica TaxID=2609417 RepID=A0AA97FAM7_9EURY|nr:replication factor C large subunit [Methanoplanus sp. FWC-SCC4]WOF15474.1 replication factor C large subunit [Methanoplanus sp. FWC-SCC4]